jgi:hypothetical protein
MGWKMEAKLDLISKVVKAQTGKRRTRVYVPTPRTPNDNRSPRAILANARARAALARRKAALALEPNRYRPKNRWPSSRQFRRGAIAPLGLAIIHKMVVTMEPGEWASWPDIGRAAGMVEPDWKGVRKFVGGYVERTEHPDSDIGVLRCPKWAYRLTPKGEAFRRLLLLLG